MRSAEARTLSENVYYVDAKVDDSYFGQIQIIFIYLGGGDIFQQILSASRIRQWLCLFNCNRNEW